MNSKLRTTLFAAAGIALAVVIGIQVANDSMALATAVGLFCAWLILAKVSDAPADAWLVGIAFVGYVVGNRGFAQIQPSALVPILPAEAVLAVALPALVFRIVVKSEAGLRRDLLNFSILAWMVIATVRVPLDVKRYSIMALRDYAMVYYAALFFVVQALYAHDAARRVIRGSITAAFVLLLPVVAFNAILPDYLAEHVTWRGIPVIFHKSDLIATSLAAGCYWLWTRATGPAKWAWIAASATSLALIGVMASPRAAMSAIAVTTGLWLLARRWRIAAAQAGFVAAAAVLSLAAILFTGREIKTSAPYSMYEHAVSIFDPEGSGTYINGESGDPGDNNRFRLVWWRDVIEDTVAVNPYFGQGFGADLATRFLADYDLLSDETFAARSPHSMIMTVFGRMGALGLAAWLTVSAALFGLAWRLVRSGDPDGSGLASVLLVVWVSGCFGVVLEGPMGAVVFWTAVGAAAAQLQRLRQEKEEDSAAEGERPVAMAGAMGSQSGD